MLPGLERSDERRLLRLFGSGTRHQPQLGHQAGICQPDSYGHYCWIIGTYQVRPEGLGIRPGNETYMTYNSFEKRLIGGQAVGSDAVLGFFRKVVIHAHVGTGIEDMLGQVRDPISPERPDLAGLE